MLACEEPSPGSSFGLIEGNPIIGATVPFKESPEPKAQIPVFATVEPDADGDGYGDETQDQCPTQATTQGACDTTAPGVQGFGVNGDQISYSLSEAATVSLQLEKKAKGRKVGDRKPIRCPRGNRCRRAAAPCPPSGPIRRHDSGSARATRSVAR